MFRELVSHLVLILVPVISLAIAIVPFAVVKKRLKRLSPSVIASDRKGAWQSHLDAQNEIASSQTPRNDKAMETGTYPHPSAIKPHITSKLWTAFFAGLIGNVIFYFIAFKFEILIQKKYIFDSISDGLLLAFIFYSGFIVTTPFIFYKLKHGHFSGKAVVYNIMVSLIVAGLVLGVWIVLAVVAYRGLFYQLN